MSAPNMKKILIILGLSLLCGTTLHAQLSILRGPQGGTNIGTGVAGDVNKCLKVLSVGPLVWTVGTCGSGGGSGGGLGSTTPWTANNFVYVVDDSSVGASSTPFLSKFFFNIATGTSATTTNLFSTNASTTNHFFSNGVGGSLSLSGLGTLANLLVSGSSTLNAFTATNSTSSQATTTSLFATTGTITTASTTSFFGSNLIACASPSFLGWSAGKFTCGIPVDTTASSTLLTDNNTFTGNNIFSKLNWTNGTGTNSTTTALYVSGIASTTEVRANTATIGLLTLANLIATASSTLQNYTFVNATGTSATTTNFFATNASTSNLFIASGAGCLEATAGGKIVTVTGAACSTGGGGAYPFQGTGNSTSTLTGFTGGLFSHASSTFQNLTFLNSTSTNATTTSLVATTICLSGDTCRTTWPSAGGGAYAFQGTNNATSTLTQFLGGLTSYASSTISALTIGISTTTSATTTTASFTTASTTNLVISGIKSALLVTDSAGTVSGYGGASACAAANFVTAISALGATTCGSSTISGVALGGTLAALTAGTTLTSGGTYTGATTRTFDIDLTHANTWTGAQMFNASTTIGINTAAGGLTINGGATTTGSALFLSSTTLNAFTFTNATGTSATTTNLLATNASTTNLFYANAVGGVETLSGKLSAANLFASGSSTLNNFTFVNATGTQATTTGFAATTICLTGDTCRTTWPSSGSGSYPFQGTNNSTSTLTVFTGGLDSYASTTIGNNTAGGGLTINGGATTTGSALFMSSTTLNAFTFTNATGTSATTTNLSVTTIGSISSSTPWASVLSLGAPAGTAPYFAIGSTTSNAGSGLVLSVNPQTYASFAFGTGTPTALFSLNASTSASAAFPNLLDISSSTSNVAYTDIFRINMAGAVFIPKATQSAGAQTYVACGAATTFEFIWDTLTCATSAAKYKTNVHDLDIGLEELLQVRPVVYNWKPTGNPAYDLDRNVNHQQIGLIADEMEKIDSRLVTYDKDGEIHGFNYEQYTAWLTKAIQELNTKVEATKRSAEEKENWQNCLIALLILYVGYNEFDKRRRK